MLAAGEPSANIDSIGGMEIARGDVRDQALMRELAKNCEAVIHTAALNRMWHRPIRDFYDINTRGTANVLRAALAAGARRFIHTSSCEVMGPAARGVVADEGQAISLCRVRGHYERSKFLAEMVVGKFAKKGLPAVILRPTAIVGPGDIHGTPPGRLIRAFLRQEIPACFDAGINVVDSRDVAMAHVAALGAGRAGQIYIVGGHNIRLSDLFGMLERESGVPAPPRTVGFHAAYAAACIRWMISIITRSDPGITVSGIRTLRHPWHFDSSKARRELGLEPRSLAETVRDTVDWYEDVGRNVPRPSEQ